MGKEIWVKWNRAVGLENDGATKVNDNGTDNRSNSKVDIQTQLAQITESKTEAYQASAKASAERHQKDEEERKAVKAAILAQYGNVREEESDNSGEEDEGKEDDLSVMRNENKEAVAKAEQEKREKCRAAALAKKRKIKKIEKNSKRIRMIVRKKLKKRQLKEKENGDAILQLHI